MKRTETFQTPRQLLVNVKLPQGHVHVETADVSETTVTLAGGSERAARQIDESIIRLEQRGDGDELIVDADPEDFGFGGEHFRVSIVLERRDPVDVRIVAPHGTNLRIATASADVRANGRFGNAAVKVASGDVEIDRVGGSLKAQTAAGDLRAGPVGGDADVRTAAGDVSIEEVGGSVSVRSASGDLRVGAVTHGSVELKSVSGDMLVGIRRGSRVWMDVKTVTGDASSELDVVGAPDQEDGPLVELRATSMSGDIRVRRA